MSARPRRTALLVTLGSMGGLAATVAAALALGTIAGALPSRAASLPARAAARHDVLLVGNAVAGTVSFLDGRTFANLGSFNAIPDLRQRLDAMNPIERAGYALVRQQEGGDRFVDDMVVSPNGRTLYVSRANLADVVAYDLVTRAQLWRFKVDGIHADHMAISPDGQRIVVSATTAGAAQVIDAASGTAAGRFATGTYPHQNDFSPDGTRIYNASIGVTALPQLLEPVKGARQLTVVDAHTLAVVRTYQFPHGIRPAVITPDQKTMYAQLSYLNGFVEFGLVSGQITRTVTMPLAGPGVNLRPDDYPQNSAHHGLALSGDGTRLCDVGTIDNYVAIVSRPTLTTDRIIPVGNLPYWAATSVDGKYCFVSISKDNMVSVISYADAREVARIPVGAFPQRERTAVVQPDALTALAHPAG